MKRHLADHHAFVADMTSAYAQLNIQGPRSRELMQLVTSADMSNEAFPFRAAREIDIGFARVLCIRITYLGELGYELYIPTEQALHVYDRLVAAGRSMVSASSTRASRRSRAAGWRRATATTATTSTTPTRSSRPASASRSISRSRAASSARTRWSRRRRRAR